MGPVKLRLEIVRELDIKSLEMEVACLYDAVQRHSLLRVKVLKIHAISSDQVTFANG